MFCDNSLIFSKGKQVSVTTHFVRWLNLVSDTLLETVRHAARQKIYLLLGEQNFEQIINKGQFNSYNDLAEVALTKITIIS
jgi:hypothetical protein